MDKRPAIPAKTKRKIRQRCGFGCVFCGLPIYEYDHIIEYSKTKHHKEDELTLLCPYHHSLKTKGLLSHEQVIHANKIPYNLKSGQVSRFTFEFLTDSPKFLVGEQSFICSSKIRPSILAPIVINRRIPFSFIVDTQGVMLSLEAQDKSGNELFKIKESELVFSTNNWDATFVGSTIKIWDKSELFVLELKHLPPNAFKIVRYSFYYQGVNINIMNDTIVMTSDTNKQKFQLSGNGTVDANIGILIGEHPKNLSVGIKLW